MDRISKLCLEGNTERSESNPGRSLGTTDKRRAAVWKTVPANELSIISPSFLGVFTRMITRYRPCFVQFLTVVDTFSTLISEKFRRMGQIACFSEHAMSL